MSLLNYSSYLSKYQLFCGLLGLFTNLPKVPRGMEFPGLFFSGIQSWIIIQLFIIITTFSQTFFSSTSFPKISTLSSTNFCCVPGSPYTSKVILSCIKQSRMFLYDWNIWQLHIIIAFGQKDCATYSKLEGNNMWSLSWQTIALPLQILLSQWH